MWQYKREERQRFEQVPVGKHRIRIKAVDKAISQSGNDMLVFRFEVSGMPNILYHFIVFLNDRPEITNRNLTNFFDSFPGIADGDFDMRKWIGQVGACEVKQDRNDPERTRISHFIRADQQGELPPWRDANGNQVPPGFAQVGVNDQLPF